MTVSERFAQRVAELQQRKRVERPQCCGYNMSTQPGTHTAIRTGKGSLKWYCGAGCGDVLTQAQ